MSQPDNAKSHYGQERTCPHCGARVAQRAKVCFFCGASLDDAPRRHLSVPWADLTLFAVIGGLVVLWWLHPPSTAARPRIALLGTPTAKVVATGDLAAAAKGTPVLVSLPAAKAGAGQALSSTLTITATVASAAAPGAAAATPTGSPSPAGTPLPTATPRTYKVAGGDSVGQIAARFNTTVQALVDANNLGADMMIHPGDELTIPAPAGTPGAATAAPTATPTGGTLIYRVSAGDTVASIAARYGSSIEWILSANKMTATDFLSIGQALMIPLSNSTPQPTATPTPGPATATPTAGPRFRVPMPVGPADGGLVASDSDALLTWTSAGVLGEDEWYVVTLLGPDGKPAPVPPYWTKSTSWRLEHELRTGDNSQMQAADAGAGNSVGAASVGDQVPPTPAAVQYSWQVQVVSGTPGKPGPVLSEASPLRKFIWR
jgi:LysM repeat protein